MQPQILHVYSHVILRVILGNNFSPEVVDIFESYSATLIPVMKALKAQRPIIARITAAFSSDVCKVNAQLERVTAFFTPLFEQCAQALEQGLDMSSVNNDWLEELVRMAPEEKRRDSKYLTNVLIGFAFTFVFSPGPSTTQIVYEFAFRPDYTKLVLEEANQVLGEQVDIWHFTRDSLRRLSLLDSFCKETHKHHPTAACKAQHGVDLRRDVLTDVDSQPDEKDSQDANASEWSRSSCGDNFRSCHDGSTFVQPRF